MSYSKSQICIVCNIVARLINIWIMNTFFLSGNSFEWLLQANGRVPADMTAASPGIRLARRVNSSKLESTTANGRRRFARAGEPA